MDDNILIWSCNRRKFMKIIGFSTSEYREKLGLKCNSVWYIQITSKERQQQILESGKYAESFYYIWDIEVLREYGSAQIMVEAKVVSNTQVLEHKLLLFENDIKNSSVGQYKTDNLTDYRLDLVLSIFPVEIDENVTIPHDPIQVSQVDDLSTSFQRMINLKHLSDVTLKCNSITLKAHKCVLSARSAVFARIFASPMKEGETGPVIIEDISSSVFDAFINYLYCGQLQIKSIGMAYDLLKTAVEYETSTLKKSCVGYLKSILSHENAIGILRVADLYDEQLKLSATIFIKEHLQDLEDSTDWLQLKSEKPALALEVYSNE